MASSSKRKHPNLASWLATFQSPSPGETHHGHASVDPQLQQAAASAVREASLAAAESPAAAEDKAEVTLREATKNTASWLEHHRTPAETSGEAERDPRIPVFKLSHGARRHAAFVCPAHRRADEDDSTCASSATDSPGKCTDAACPYYGAAKVLVPAFYRCPGSCRGAVLAPSLCYPIAASICEREDEPIFAVVGCASCEHQIRSDSSGSLALCGKVCIRCIPVYTDAALATRAIVLTERYAAEESEAGAGGAAAPIERQSSSLVEDATSSGDKHAEDPPSKRVAR